MDLKNLEEAHKFLNVVKALDAEIIQIEKMAMLLANGDTRATFELKVEDLEANTGEAGKPVIVDGDGSLVPQMGFYPGFMFSIERAYMERYRLPQETG